MQPTDSLIDDVPLDATQICFAWVHLRTHSLAMLRLGAYALQLNGLPTENKQSLHLLHPVTRAQPELLIHRTKAPGDPARLFLCAFRSSCKAVADTAAEDVLS